MDDLLRKVDGRNKSISFDRSAASKPTLKKRASETTTVVAYIYIGMLVHSKQRQDFTRLSSLIMGNQLWLNYTIYNMLNNKLLRKYSHFCIIDIYKTNSLKT